MSAEESLEKLSEVVIKGRIKEAKPLAEEAIAAGASPEVIIFDALSKAMGVVGQKYESKQYFLPQVLLAAQTMYQALDVVLPLLKAGSAADTAAKVVIGVVEGDVHDIGKNIVKAMLTGAGYTIFDMGRDCPTKTMIDKVKAEGANIVATSSLMTPTLAAMKEIERVLAEENLKPQVKSIIGGGATTKDFAAQIGADAWAYDAVEAVEVVKNLLK